MSGSTEEVSMLYLLLSVYMDASTGTPLKKKLFTSSDTIKGSWQQQNYL